ncbi:MAG TPA: hypothetical protein VF725_01215 [Ktedonobacterales bacterium]
MENIIGYVGSFLKHVIGVLLLSWRRMLRAGMIAFGIGFVLALLIAVIGTGQAFPGALAVVVAALFGAALGYGVAVTVLIEEFVLGVIDMLHMLEGDVAKVAHITEAVAEREAGDVTQGLRRLLGLPISGARRPVAPPPTLRVPRTPANPTPTSPAPTDATLASSTGHAVNVAHLTSTAIEAAGAIGAAIASRAATSAPQSAPPEPASGPVGEPVPADRLPRITWTYEHEAVKPPAPASEPTPTPTVDMTTPAPSTAPTTTEPAPAVVAPLAEGAETALAAHLAQPAAAPEPAPASAPASAPAPEYEAPLEDEPLATPTFDDEPAPATVPLPQAEQVDSPASPTAFAAPPPLDPVMFAPAPATTPLAREEVEETPAPEPAAPDPIPPLDSAMLTAAPATTPLLHADGHAAPAPEPAPEPGPAPESAAAPAAPEAVEDAPPARSSYGRDTQPIGDLDVTFDRASRAGGAPTNPRLSVPESGLWERLSQALIDRAGAPSGPFAAPSRASEPPATPPADAAARETDEPSRD